MPKPKTENTIVQYSYDELNKQWQYTVQALNRMHIKQILSFDLSVRKRDDIMRFLKDAQAKLELLNGK